MRAYYASKISEHISETPDGFLLCRDVPIARSGWYEYVGREIGLNTDNLVRVYRSPEQVFASRAIASFEGKPTTNNHPPDGVSPVDAKLYVKGSTQNVRRGEGSDSDLLLADLMIYDDDLIREIKAGKRQVSAGYECDYTTGPDGTYAQVGIVGNHVAVVDEGRAGDRVRILDSAKGGKKEVLTDAAHEAALTRMIDSAIKDYETVDADSKCDSHKNSDGTFKGGFDGAVAYFQCRGYSEEVAKKIAGKIAAHKGDSAPPTRRKGADKVPKTVRSITRRTAGPVSNFLVALGLKHFAQDAEPEDLQDMVDAVVEERHEEPEIEPKALEGEKTKDEPEGAKIDESVEKRLAHLEELLTKVLEGKTGEKSAEEKIDDALQQMENPEATGEEALVIDPAKIDDGAPSGEVAPPETRPESGMGIVDRAAQIAALRAVKASLAGIKDPAVRQQAADAALKQIATDRATYGKIAEAARKKAQDAKVAPTPAEDLSDLGRKIAEKYNPHYKKAN